MNNPFARARAIFGPPATGLGAMTTATTTGCLAHGCWRRKSVFFGLLPTGAGTMAPSFFTMATGVPMLASMAVSVMVSAILERGLKVDVGIMDAFSTIAP